MRYTINDEDSEEEQEKKRQEDHKRMIKMFLKN